METSYIDYLSTLPQNEVGESLKDLIRDNYDFFKHYLDELFHIEANYIYLNLVCGVSQTRIAEMIGVSQYGVSKRITAGLNKLSYLIRIPEKNRAVVKKDLSILLPTLEADVVFNYYFMKTYALTGRLMNLDHNLVNSVVTSGINMLHKLAKATDLRSFLTTFIANHNLNIKSMQELEVYHPAVFDKCVYFKNHPEEIEGLVLSAQRYVTYIQNLIKVSSYGDYTFKLYDKDRV
jgi:hypothetical protein